MEFTIKSGSPEKQRSACVVVGVFDNRKLRLVIDDGMTTGASMVAAITAIKQRGAARLIVAVSPSASPATGMVLTTEPSSLEGEYCNAIVAATFKISASDPARMRYPISACWAITLNSSCVNLPGLSNT